MTTDQIYKTMQLACAKNQNGNLTPDQFNTVLMPVAQNNYLDFLLGEYQKYRVQRPIAVVEFGQNERVRQSISPLIYSAILNPSTSTGMAPYPSDYEYNDAMWGLYGFYNIRFIQQDRLDSYYHSKIDPIATNPVYLINHEGFQFYPENIGAARMSYVRTAPPIFWGHDEDAHGRPVYNPVKSQQPVWAETDIYEVIVRALALIGVNLQLGVVIQYANDVKNNGQ